MRIKVKDYEDAEKIGELFEDSHIERKGDDVYLVIDRVKQKNRS